MNFFLSSHFKKKIKETKKKNIPVICVLGHTAADLTDGNKKITKDNKNKLFISMFLNFIFNLSIVYVIFNSLSIWLTASLINNILTDFDLLIQEHTKSAQNINSLNEQLKYWTNELILRETPKKHSKHYV